MSDLLALTIFSFGGGVQSTAALCLAAQGQVPYRTFVFANVGHDSEHPATLAYLRDVAHPYAEAHGLTLVEIERRRRPHSAPTLLQEVLSSPRSIPIPVRMANGAPGNRLCTVKYKIRAVAAWTKRHGATAACPATVGLGISLDEWHRQNPSRIAHQRHAYPLLALRLTRQDCVQVIARAGLPVPPKSACWFCPMHGVKDWQRLARETPELFAQAAALERLLQERRTQLGKDAVWLSRTRQPLALIGVTPGPVQAELDLTCDSNFCMT